MTATYEQVALNRERGAEKSASIYHYSIEIQTCARRRSEESLLDSRCLSSASKLSRRTRPVPAAKKD